MKCIDLFAGCGGLSLGSEQVGFEICAAFENRQAAATVYRQNFNHPVHELDLSDVTAAVENIAQYHPDLIMGTALPGFFQRGKA